MIEMRMKQYNATQIAHRKNAPEECAGIRKSVERKSPIKNPLPCPLRGH